jgi:hypothetical protein
MHNAILLLQKGIRCVLVSQFNPSNLGKGMAKLLKDGSKLLTIVKLTNAIMANLVLKVAKNKADAASKAASTTIAPAITLHSEAQEEANRLHVINQLVIGAKEVAVEAVMKLVGSNITDAVLQTADGSNNKSIDDYTLFAVMAAAIDGNNQPSTTNILEQLLEVINHAFDFRKQVSVNMELMQLNAARMATYGIAISIPQLTLMLSNQSRVWMQILIGNAGYLQKIHVQPCTQCHLTARHFERAGRSRWGAQTQRCTSTRNRHSTLSC